MTTLEVTCRRTVDNNIQITVQQLSYVTDFTCETVAYPFHKLKEQETNYGDGRLAILRADACARVSPYEISQWTKIEAWCCEPRYGRKYKSYMFIEHHATMSHTVSFMYE